MGVTPYISCTYGRDRVAFASIRIKAECASQSDGQTCAALTKSPDSAKKPRRGKIWQRFVV